MKNSGTKDSTPEADENTCKGCEKSFSTNESGYCQDCLAKIDRDFIRLRQWDYSTLAFGIEMEKREDLRANIIDTHGKALELLPPRDKHGCLENNTE